MKEINLTPKATEDLEAIWSYSQEQFGLAKADEYISRISNIFEVLATHEIGTERRELGEHIFSLPIERHVIFFVPSEFSITVIRVLNQSQDVVRHLSWT
ncbi:type II toxin-antitoxin system RelE/ParE family toxin [Ewingella americana]|jgi:toxin ParE1/3/4